MDEQRIPRIPVQGYSAGPDIAPRPLRMAKKTLQAWDMPTYAALKAIADAEEVAVSELVRQICAAWLREKAARDALHAQMQADRVRAVAERVAAEEQRLLKRDEERRMSLDERRALRQARRPETKGRADP